MLQKRIKMEFSISEFIAREILSNNCTKGEVEIENVYSFRLKSKKKNTVVVKEWYCTNRADSLKKLIFFGGCGGSLSIFIGWAADSIKGAGKHKRTMENHWQS